MKNYSLEDIKNRIRNELYSDLIKGLGYQVKQTSSGSFSIMGNGKDFELKVSQVDIAVYFNYKNICWDSMILVDLPLNVLCNEERFEAIYLGSKDRFNNFDDFYQSSIKNPLLDWFTKTASKQINYCGEINRVTWVEFS